MRDDGTVPVLAIESDERLTLGQTQFRLICHDHLQPSPQLPWVVSIARIPKRCQPLMRMSLQERGAGPDHFSTLAPRIARRTDRLETPLWRGEIRTLRQSTLSCGLSRADKTRRPPIVVLADPTDLPRPRLVLGGPARPARTRRAALPHSPDPGRQESDCVSSDEATGCVRTRP